MNDNEPPPVEIADPHFGTDEQMLAWCEKEGITPTKDSRGAWDWQAAWDGYMSRPNKEEQP
ncbi:MAG: hypothetical protein ABIS50_15260 [Luteolibacter sp.]|uniref:hypothetical protein n=1 Tax=Luteolibacter sp. TaxID=1962973 RepID=UPI0032636406